MHSELSRIVGFVRHTTRLNGKVQETAVRGAGASRVFYDVAKLIRACRATVSDTVLVTHVHLLAEPKHPRDKGGPRVSLRHTLDQLRKRNVTLHDLDTGIIAQSIEQYLVLERRGTDLLARGGPSKKRGRRLTPIPADKLTVVEAMWRNVVKYRTNDAAALAINALDDVRISKQALLRRFGNSGRKPKPTA